MNKKGKKGKDTKR